MSGLADIDRLFRPGIIGSLSLDLPPVSCRIWKREEEYEEISLKTIYPFDTLDTIKQTISLQFKDDKKYNPQFLFVGIQKKDGTFAPLEYTWYPIGTQKAKNILYLPSPVEAMASPVASFVTRAGNKPSNSLNPRGRTMIEEIFGLKVPTLYVFPFHRVLRAFEGVQPISNEDWYSRFYPFYPNLDQAAPSTVTKEDAAFAKMFMKYLEDRRGYLKTINRIFEGGIPLPDLRITGVKQLRLTIQEAAETFEDCQSLFYERKVTKEVPYMRIIPREGTPITKVLVGGVLPIPAIDNPEVIAQWAKETTPTMGEDFLMLKYVHRAAMGSLCPIYGTIRIYHDGTADILVQPPKHIRKLEPATDFHNFGSRLQSICEGLPIDLTHCEIGEAALIFQVDSSIKFNKQILRKRLAAFSPFFQEIAPMKDVQSIISLRYKVVSQYASENSIFAFLTQYAESKKLEGTYQSTGMIAKLQEEFLMSELDATMAIEKWYEKEGVLSIAIPEENEFMEGFNPGIDIHIFGAHPSYSFHVHRIDSYVTLERLYSLLSVLFMEDEEGLLVGEEEPTFRALASAVEKKVLKSERRPEPDEDEEEEARSTVSGAEAATAATEARIGLRSFRRVEDEDQEDSEEESPEEVKAPIKVVKEKKVKKEITREDIDPKGWFLRQLNDGENGDTDLFDFKPTIKEKSYAKQCAANEERMPSALSAAQFKYMLKVYNKEIEDGSLFFNVYPLKKGEKDKMAGQGGIPSDAKEVTVSRYGSSIEKEKYYFCPELFCLKDRMMILESDFDAEEDRDGEPKDEYTCPFCKGTEILDHKKMQPGATVFRRIAKEKASPPRPHLYIGFAGKIGKNAHPQNMGLPCCHLMKKTLRIMDPEYDQLRGLKLNADRGTYLDVETIAEEDKAVETVTKAREKVKAIKKRVEDAEEAGYKGAIAYEPIFDQIKSAYIVDKNKDLGPGRIGILPDPFDTYFQQNSATFVKRTTTQQKLAAKSRGFLRMGVEIGPLTAKCDMEPRPIESLLGVLAPLLHANSINEVRGLLLTAITGPGGVKTFVNANFGNLVNEFYVPSDADLGIERDLENMTDTTKIDITPQLRRWAQNHLQVTVTEANHYAVRRIYKSYNRFEAFLRDKTQRKDLRHLSSFLTEAFLLGDHNRRGLQIIVLEWSAGQEKVTVKCSPYGFSLEHHLENDFVFLWHNGKGVYELIFYVENTPEENSTTLRWKYKNKSKWPRVVQDRVNEYMSKCQSQHTSIFTSQMDIKSESLIPLSMALTTPLSVAYKETKYEVEPYGIVRDSYNHAVFVLYPLKPLRIGPDSEMVAMPVVDDGFFPKHQQLYLDVQDFISAPANRVIDYYNTYLTPAFAMYPGYKVKNKLRNEAGKGKIVGIRLENRIFIPTEDAEEGSDLSAYPDKERKVDEWDINRDLSEPCGTADIKDNTQKRLEELYQYFRYTVANWIATEGGDEVQESIEEIVFDRTLPDYEKRKRLEILCGTFARDEDREHGWLGWMQPTTEQWDMPMGLLRKDCRVQEKGQCDGACIWKEEEGVCALHVDEEVSIRSSGPMVNTRVLFTRRVIDELIHFPKRRKELLQNRVSQMSAIVEPIREGDQYIIPERGMTWLALLRLDWRPQEQEVPLFYEEMAQPPTGDADEAPALPEDLQALVGSKTRYEIWLSSEESLAAFLQIPAASFRLDDTMIQPYVRRTNTPVGIVDLTANTIRFVKGTGEPTLALVFVVMEDSIGLLVDKRGRPTVSIAGLDGALLERWSVAEKVVSTVAKKGLVRTAITVKKSESAATVSTASTAATTSVPEKVVSTVAKKDSAPAKKSESVTVPEKTPKKGLVRIAPIKTVVPEEKTVVVEAPKKKGLRRVRFANNTKPGSLSVVKEPAASATVKTVAPAASVKTVAPPVEETVAPAASAKTVAPVASAKTVAPPVEETVAPVASAKTVAPVASAKTVAPVASAKTVALSVEQTVAPAPPASIEEEIVAPAATKEKTVAPSGVKSLPRSAAVPPPIAAPLPKPASLAGPTLSVSKKASVAPPLVASVSKKASVLPPPVASVSKKASVPPPPVTKKSTPKSLLRRVSVSSSNDSSSSNEQVYSTSSNSGEATESNADSTES